ncbi:MAG: hypothetical protein NVS3B25_16780 [Hymenobacter sp.]
MKKVAYLLAALLLTGIVNIANAQTEPKNQSPKTSAQVLHDSTPDYYVMVDGKMMMKMKDGQMMPMTENATMSNGNMVMTDGTCMMKNGTKMTMKNGQCMMMDGKMSTVDKMKKSPKMKSGKMGKMKM